jgi:outer membrane receptor protein involved in Fe transport
MKRWLIALTAFLPLADAEEVVEPLPEIAVVARRSPVAGGHIAWEGNPSVIDAADFPMAPGPSASYEDFLAMVPGAYAGNPVAGTFSLRGVGQDSVFSHLNTGSNPLIAVLENGVPLSAFAVRYLPPLLWDLERAEVRRGPQLHLTGPNAIAGAVLLDSQMPSLDSQHGRWMAEVAEEGMFRSGFSQNLLLIPGRLALRADAFHQESDGFETNAYDKDRDYGATRRDRQDLRLRWLPAGDDPAAATIDLSLVHDAAAGNPLALVRAAPGYGFYDRTAFVDTTPEYQTERWAGTLDASIALGGNATLRLITGVQTLSRTNRSDMDETTALHWYTDGGGDEVRFTQSVRLAGGEDRLKWEVGSYFEHSEYDLAFAGAAGPPLPWGTPLANHAAEKVRVAAIDGRFDWEMTGGWHAIGGLRINGESREMTAASAFGPLPEVETAGDESELAWLPELGIEWRSAADLSSGIRVARAYRAAGFSHAPTLGLVRCYDPENGWEVEWATRKSFRTLQLSSSVFHSWLDDMQVPYDAPGGFPGVDTLVANAARSRRYGAELEARWQAADPLAFSAGLAWTHTRLDAFQSGDGVDRAGGKFPNAPEWTASLGIDYRPATGVFGSVLFSYADSTFSSVGNPKLTGLESRRLLSAKLGYAWENAEIYLFGSNLLDDEYALVRLERRAVSNPASGKAGAPRTIGVGGEWHW